MAMIAAPATVFRWSHFMALAKSVRDQRDQQYDARDADPV